MRVLWLGFVSRISGFFLVKGVCRYKTFPGWAGRGFQRVSIDVDGRYGWRRCRHSDGAPLYGGKRTCLRVASGSFFLAFGWR
jgi:hypothetical protein